VCRFVIHGVSNADKIVQNDWIVVNNALDRLCNKVFVI